MLWLSLLLSGLVWHQGVASTLLPPLPQAQTNNAVAVIPSTAGSVLITASGLGPGKRWQDISSKAWILAPGASAWRQLVDVPGPPRLASTAVTLGGAVWLVGGYRVLANGQEVTTAAIYRMGPPWHAFRRVTRLPVAVDDALALSYQDRYLIVVSGWHDQGNVAKVQIFDRHNRTWRQAAPFPGTPVFGHAGLIAGDHLLLVDGVAVVGLKQGKKQFALIHQSWLGEIDLESPAGIHWRKILPHPGPARYRAAGALLPGDRFGVIVGGSDNPYNYTGMGYDGQPSEPLASILRYDFKCRLWSQIEPPARGAPGPSVPHLDGRAHGLARPVAAMAVMDLRNAVIFNHQLVTVGGMTAGQQVSTQVRRIPLADLDRAKNCIPRAVSTGHP